MSDLGSIFRNALLPAPTEGRLAPAALAPYNTGLGPQEDQFRQWVVQNHVPFDVNAPVSDYDMRGFWQALTSGDPTAATAINPNDHRMHYPDRWKTPLHKSFSNESRWAGPGAPQWINDHQLAAPDGRIVFDETRK